MPLPSSGTISMSQVNVELGLSSTALISLNDAAVRNLFGVPSGTISMSNGYGKSATSYWISQLTGSGSGDAIAVDSTGATITTGRVYGTGGTSSVAQINKFNADGTIAWQQKFTLDTYAYLRGVATDSSNNIYAVGYTSFGSNDILIVKLNSAGSLVWQRAFSGSYSDAGTAISVTSSGDVYLVAGASINGSYQEGVIAKIDTNGNLQWHRALYISGNYDDALYGIKVDNSGNAYVVGWGNSSTNTGNDMYVAKYNASGTLQWQRRVYQSGTSSERGNSIAIDTSGNCFACGYTTISNVTSVLLVKFDTNGTLQWSRRIGASTANYGNAVAVDASGNPYVSGYTTANGNDVYVAKFNTSGTLQWQRTIGTTTTTSYEVSNAITINPTSTAVHAAGTMHSKIPTDGSRTGTYGTWVYSAGSLTVTNDEFTSVAGNLGDNTYAASNWLFFYTPSGTLATTTYTLTRVSL